MVGNGDPVRITAQVAKGMFRTAEGTFRVDYPIVTEQLAEPRGEGFGLSQKCQIAMKAELAIGERLPESRYELAAKNTAEHFDWKKERIAGFDPARVIGRQSACRNHTMHVWMVFQFLIPGMEHAEEAYFRAEMFRVASDFQERFRTASEQKAVNDFLVL